MVTDKKQRTEALDISQSFIVQAPAGSGKTELLTQRYLKLLAVCNQPEEVIALTFTNKAVDELTKRVLDSLKATLNTAPNQEHKKLSYELATKVMLTSDKNNWHLLKNPNRLQISTLDSLANKIVKQQTSPTDDVYDPVTSWQINEVYSQAISQVLELIDEKEYQKSIINVLKHLGNNLENFTDLITSMLQKRDQWLRHLISENTLNPDTLNKTLTEIINKHLKILNKNIPSEFNEDFYTNIKVAFKDFNSEIKDINFWQIIRNICLTQGGSFRKSLNVNDGFPKELKNEKEIIIDIVKSIHENENFLTLLQQFDNLPSAKYTDYELQILKDISYVLKLTSAQLEVIFKEKQLCDYVDINLKADTALGDIDSPSDIALFLDVKINHILLDEFQDTSITQVNLLKQLIEGWQINDNKTLFLVGDPMQSIYRFREAQVGLFVQIAHNGIASIKPKLLTLTNNFRSTQAVVTANNELFQQIFPQEENVDLGKIVYSPSCASNSIKNKSPINFYAFSDKQYKLQATQVIDIIKQIPKDEDVAILVRARSHLVEIVGQLDDNKMKFEAVRVQSLNEHYLVRDLLSLTYALNNPNDKLSWLALLRSPWCGLSLDDLLVLSNNKNKSFWYFLNEKHILSSDGLKRLDFFLTAIKPIFEKRGTFVLSDLVISCCARLEIPEHLNLLENKIKQLFLKTLISFEQTLDFEMEQLEDVLKELFTPTITSRIKIMTIHSAKGLEFDNVIIPNLNRIGARDKNDILLTLEDIKNNFIVSPSRGSENKEENKIYKYIKSINSQKANYELLRLLYVAMTRAKNQIYLLSTATYNVKENKYNAKAGTFLKFIMELFREYFDLINRDEVICESSEYSQKLYKINSTELIKAKNIENKLMSFEKDYSNNQQQQIGILTHRYFEFEQLPTTNKIKNDLLTLSIKNNIEQHIKDIKQMLDNAKNDPKAKWIFTPRDNTQAEAEFIYKEDDINKTMIIDRFFIEDDVLWIIDFKTTQKSIDESLEDFKNKMIKNYQKQLNQYENILKNIYPQQIKKALYLPAVPIFIELG